MSLVTTVQAYLGFKASLTFLRVELGPTDLHGLWVRLVLRCLKNERRLSRAGGEKQRTMGIVVPLLHSFSLLSILMDSEVNSSRLLGSSQLAGWSLIDLVSELT